MFITSTDDKCYNRYMKSMFNSYYALRWKILERDEFTCQYCGQKAPDAHLEVDHILPRAEGGEDIEDNLVTACFACNRGKSALSLITKRTGKFRILPKYKKGKKDTLIEFFKSRPKLNSSEIA